MKKSSSLALLREIHKSSLPLAVDDGPQLDQLIAYETAGYIRLNLGPVSKLRETYGRRGESVVLSITRSGRKALGFA